MTTGTLTELFYLKWKNQPIEKQGNLKRSTNFPTEFAFQAISNGFVSVDTFFFVSGFLVVYTTFQSVKKVNGRFSIPVFLMHRYLRLAPTLLMVSAILIVIPLLGSGPIWHETVDHLAEDCKKWLWTNAIFLNNFIGTTTREICLFHSWYLSCEMQLFILSLCVIIPLLKNRGIISVCVTITFMLISVATIALITHFRDFPPVQLFANPDLSQQYEFSMELYIKPYTHLAPYAVGLLLGHLYLKKPQLAFPKSVKVLGWLLTIGCNLAVVYGVYPWNNGIVPSRPVAILYAATHRLAWTFGVAWVTVLCITGQGGIVNKILSFKYFIPFSRITLEIYLLHPLVQWVYFASLHDRIYASHYIAVYVYIGHLVIVYILSFVCCLAFDTPFYRLQKLLLIQKFEENKERN
ncbi:nose resistant to fluoxetine protein 6-like [Limulus polyphemus]|uniref:Nose resistant to fluoxetine protein 6-like n=1 Tax=Limulus polyphemus TaxID=6850 RepID=A0ABM1TKK5_LIMPO|nr:nose resistant to fluoxetine protein 6-like [Limulus polyphemus]